MHCHLSIIPRYAVAAADLCVQFRTLSHFYTYNRGRKKWHWPMADARPTRTDSQCIITAKLVGYLALIIFGRNL